MLEKFLKTCFKKCKHTDEKITKREGKMMHHDGIVRHSAFYDKIF